MHTVAGPQWCVRVHRGAKLAQACFMLPFAFRDARFARPPPFLASFHLEGRHWLSRICRGFLPKNGKHGKEKSTANQQPQWNHITAGRGVDLRRGRGRVGPDHNNIISIIIIIVSGGSIFSDPRNPTFSFQSPKEDRQNERTPS